MSNMLLLFGFILILGFVSAIQYTAVSDDERIYKNCKGEEDKPLTKWFDISNLTFEFVSDDEVIVDGHAVSIAPIKSNQPLFISVQIDKEVRGEYIQPTVDIKRPDFCSVVFRPTEVWYMYTKNVPNKSRTCPCVKGSVYTLSKMSSKSEPLTFPDHNLAGAYRATVRMGVDEQNYFCAYYDFHLFRT